MECIFNEILEDLHGRGTVTYLRNCYIFAVTLSLVRILKLSNGVLCYLGGGKDIGLLTIARLFQIKYLRLSSTTFRDHAETISETPTDLRVSVCADFKFC